MQSLSFAALPEIILHLEDKSSIAQELSGRTSASASTAASSRSTSPSDEAFPSRRSNTVAGVDAEGCGREYRRDLAAHDANNAANPRRSQTFPGIGAYHLGHAYPAGLVVRNTFLDFVEDKPDFLQMRRIKSLPSEVSPDTVSATSSQLTQKPAVMLELASILDVMPLLGSSEAPSVGSLNHNLGECRPCAFFWKPGSCTNGVDCRHCHLCDPSAKRRRLKERKALLKSQKERHT